VKAGYKAFKKAKPGIMPEAMDKLMPDFAATLDTYYEAWQARQPGVPFSAFLASRSNEVADDLLAVTDKITQIADNRALTAAYNRLRSMGKKHVSQAVPRIGRLVESYLS
ncbi:MAG: hypothetical protein JRI97_12280, partial [Deltaproteobacteria bacterium]|nr:hypothetical protein [Deltaproteobacteria bacterium]